MIIPAWVDDPNCEVAERQKMLVRFQLHFAALVHNRDCSLAKLSDAAGFHPNYLQLLITRGVITERVRAAVRQVAGVDPFVIQLPDDL